MGPTLSLLYSKQNTVTDAGFKHMKNLLMMDDMDSQPIIEELSKFLAEMAF